MGPVLRWLKTWGPWILIGVCALFFADEALAQFQAARVLDPLMPPVLSNMETLRLIRGEYAQARLLSAELGRTLPFDNLTQLRQALFAEFPHLAAIDVVPTNKWKALKPKEIKGKAFTNAINDYFLTNPIARASQVMAELSGNAKARKKAPLAAE